MSLTRLDLCVGRLLSLLLALTSIHLPLSRPLSGAS